MELKYGSTFGKTAGALQMDTLTVTDGGVLKLGANATISFADSSAKTWSGALLIKGFREGAVRFGTSASALTDEQVEMIRAEKENGRTMHLCISSNGYLAPLGMMIVIQ